MHVRSIYIHQHLNRRHSQINLQLIYCLFMEEKAESKIAVHHVLIKNGFYRLPMQSLSEILKLLDMPESLEPKIIQENAINGIIKAFEKYNTKFGEHINQPKYNNVSRETKDFDTISSISKKNNSTMSQIPPLISQQTPPNSMLSMYNPMGMNYMRPPGMPPGMPPTQLPTQNGDLNQSNRYIQEAIRMQQMYMYYYGMYGGFNPMMNPQYPGMNNFMNPYTNFSQTPNTGKNPGQPGIPNMPMPPMNSMGSVNPLAMGMNPMAAGIPGYPPMGGMGGMMGMPPVMGGNMPKTNVSSGIQGTKANKLQEQMSSLTNPNQKGMNVQSAKQSDVMKANLSKTRPSEQKRSEKNLPDLSKMNSQNSMSQLKKSQKKRMGQNSVQKQKLTIQNPPFIVGQVSPSTSKKVNKEGSKEINNQQNPILKNCACKGFQKYEETFLCSICNRTFHFQCLNEPIRRYQSKEPIQCYHCRMRFIDPLNKVKEVIAENYIPNITQNKFWLQCNLKPYQYLCKQKGKNQVRNEIQMRCLKVSHTQNNQITWPDQCIIKLNGERIIQIPALQMNSSLKKRKDYSIIITQNIYSKITQSESQSLEKVKLSLEIKSLTKEEASHKKIKNNFTFAFAIYFIERLTVDQLYQRIVAQQKVPEVPDYMNKLMRTGEKQVQIDKISISLRDPFTWDLIKTPVRGNKCLHGQCFDLKTFISFMSTARNRTWKCPVCNKDARKFTIDSQQLALIKKVQQTSVIPSEITFMRSGQIVVKADHQSDDQQSRSEKTKKIQKSPKLERNNSRGQRENNESKQSRMIKQSKQMKEPQIDEKKASKEAVKEIVLDIDQSQN